jgi:hypothetical protein
MITTTVTAHTGSIRTKDLKVVTGTLVEYRRRELGPSHYTLDVVIIDAEGVTYVTGKGRIIEEVVTVVDDSQEEAEMDSKVVVDMDEVYSSSDKSGLLVVVPAEEMARRVEEAYRFNLDVTVRTGTMGEYIQIGKGGSSYGQYHVGQRYIDHRVSLAA